VALAGAPARRRAPLTSPLPAAGPPARAPPDRPRVAERAVLLQEAADCTIPRREQEDEALQWMDVNGASIRYELAGKAGPSVVLLHEMGGSLESWDEVIPVLSEKFRILRFDQRGSGQSEKVRQEFTNDLQVDDLEALLKAVGLAPPYHIVSVAASTTQALRFLERHPEQVAKLVFCNPAPGVDPSRAGALDERAAFAAKEGMRAALAVTLDKSYPPEMGDRATYEAYRGRYLAQDPVCFGFMNRCLARTDMRHMLARIDRPTLVVAGRHDTVRPPAGTEELAGKIPGARFALIEAGHFMPTNNPKALTALLQDFFAA
jgi:3-oxoadipate enol-lactonase